MSVRSIDPARKVEASDDLPRRQRQRLETRQRLLEAALDEFRQVGFANAQIDRIVEKVGVSRGTFYFHFPSKEHVLLESQRRAEAEIVERLRSLGPHPDSVGEFLGRVYETILSGLDVDEGLRREILAMYIRQPMQIELINEPLILEIVDYFADAVERGVIRDDIPPEQLTIRFLSSLFSLLTIPDDELTSEEGRDAFATTIELFLNGASTRK